jgi:hypothetical protein
MTSPLRMRSTRPLALVAVCLVITASPAAHAGLTVYYEEDFTGQQGEGITAGGAGATYSNSSWSVDGTTAPNALGHAQVSAAPTERFEFNELAGNGNNGITGSVLFETTAVAISIGNPAYLSYLTMTLDATLAGVSTIVGDGLVVQSVINNSVVATTNLTLNTAGQQVLHDLAPFITDANTPYNYVLRVTATHLADNTVTSNFTIDNILVEGLSVPEPASMSLLGMGVAAMCTAGYRRRRKAAPSISG